MLFSSEKIRNLAMLLLWLNVAGIGGMYSVISSLDSERLIEKLRR
jgi:hypothetical protein